MPAGYTVPIYNMAPNTYYYMRVNLKMDFGARTVYNSGVSDDGMYNYESYGLNIFAWAKLIYEHEIMDKYWAEYQFTFLPLDFTPYKQIVNINRGDAPSGSWGSTQVGQWLLSVGKFFTRVQ